MKKSNLKTKLLASITCLSFGVTGLANAGAHSEDVYGPFPVTLKGYSGDVQILFLQCPNRKTRYAR